MNSLSQHILNHETVFPHGEINNRPMKQWDGSQEFLNAMRHAGINFKGNVIADGTMQRFATDKKGQKDGWYVFYGKAGAFGDWSKDINEKWHLKSEPLPYKDSSKLHQQIENAQKISKEETICRHEESAAIAWDKWQSYSQTGSSDYLVGKKINAFGIRFSKNHLIIPMKDVTGKLWSLQSINPNGTKRFLTGGRKKGCFHHIGAFKEGEPIFVTEGYATGASVHMATKQTTVIAFDAGNLAPVISELRKAYPTSPVIIAGDDDCWNQGNVGRTKAEHAAQTYDCSVIFPTFNNTGTKPTDFNDLHVLEGLQVVKAQLEPVINSVDWPDPKPINDIKKDLPPVEAMSMQMLPKPYQAWLVDVAERMQCPLDYVAVGAIIVTASIIGAGCGVRPKQKDSWTVIPNLWGGIIGPPSSLKSPALKEVLTPLENLEAEAYEAYEKDLRGYAVDIESYKAVKETIKKKMMKAAACSDSFDMEQARAELRELKEPEPPACKRYCTNDATIEKMHELLSQNDRGLLIFRDELMGLLTSWEKEGHESDRSFYLEAWNGYGSKTTDRIGRGTIRTKNLCVSLLGSTQPSKLLSYFQRVLGGLENDGLLQRFQMLVCPDEQKEWKLVDHAPDIQARDQAFAIMTKLSQMNFCDHGAILDEGSGIPYFQFDEPAQIVFYEWLTELEHKLRNNSDDSIVTEHFAKYRKLMPALALIFHLIDVAAGKGSGLIPEKSVKFAAAWCDYLESHARRIYESSLDLAYQAARKLARKIQSGELEQLFDTRKVYRKNWSLLRNREEVQAACEVLIDEGWIKSNELSEKGKTKPYYFINPKIVAKTSS